MKALCPRHRRLNQKGRLQAAKHWLPKYNGKNIVLGYSKHFGVDKLCAAIELRMIGYKIPEDYIQCLKKEQIVKQKLKEQKRANKHQPTDELPSYPDEGFYFVAGYTSIGFPYGLIFDELEYEQDNCEKCDDSEEPPF